MVMFLSVQAVYRFVYTYWIKFQSIPKAILFKFKMYQKCNTVFGQGKLNCEACILRIVYRFLGYM